MDWRRTKTLFIVLLVLLNLFLAATLLYGNTIGSGQNEYEAHAVRILSDRGITYAGNWPDGPETAGMLRFESVLPTADKLLARMMPDARSRMREDGIREYTVGSRTLRTGKGTDGRDEMVYEDPDAGYVLAGSSDDGIRRSVGDLFRAIGLGKYHLALDEERTDGSARTLTYVQPYREGLLFDNRVIVRLQGGGIRSLTVRLHKEQQMMEPVGGGTGEVLTVQQALLLSPVRGPLELRDVRFGWGQADAGELYFSPMWRIRLADGREIRLDAYTGVLLATQENAP